MDVASGLERDIESDNDAYFESLNAAAGSAGSGIAEPTDSHGRREGQLIAQAVEASLQPSDGSAQAVDASLQPSAGTAAGSVAAGSEVVINEATGKRLYGMAAKAYIAKRQRQG